MKFRIQNIIKGLICLGIFLSQGDGAFAQKSKRAKRTRTKVVKKESANKETIGDILKKMQNKKNLSKRKSNLPTTEGAAFKRTNVSLSAIKPPSTSALYDLEGDGYEVRYEKLTDREIKELYSAVKEFKRSPNRGKLWLRLADRYVEKAKLVKFRKYREYDKKVDEWEKKKIGPRPKVNLEESRAFNKQSIELYKSFLKSFPKSKKIPEALYFLGYNHYELGQESQGSQYYKILTTKHKNSRFVNESNFALGDYYFEKNNWKEAYKHYQRVTLNKKNKLYLLSLYKMGWSAYRLGRLNEAMTHMVAVFRESQKRRYSGKEKSEGRLGAEALKDIVSFYPDVKGYKDAEAYFNRLAGVKVTKKLLEKLAYLYSNKGNREAARHLFSRLIEMDPLSPKSFDYQYQIVLGFSASGKSRTFKTEMYKWISDYSSESRWGKTNAKDIALLKKAYEKREFTLRNYVLQIHHTSKKSGNIDARSRATRWYDLYIQSFPDSKQIADMHFFFGELLYDMKEFKKAALQYEWVVRTAPKSKYYNDAVLNSVITFEKLLPPQQEMVAAHAKAAKETKIPMSQEVSKFIFSSNRYLESAKKDDSYYDISFKVGQLYYLHNNYAQAVAQFEPIIKTKPNSEIGQDSVNFILDIYGRREDYKGLARIQEVLLKDPRIRDSKAGNSIREIQKRVEFKRAQQLQEQKKWFPSAQKFEQFVGKYPTSPLVVSAIYNAAVNYKDAGSVDDSIRMYEKLARTGRTKGSDSKFKKEAAKILPGLYEKSGSYTKAALAYQRFALDFPSDPSTTSYLYNAAIIFDGKAFYNDALRNYDLYFKKERSGKDRLEVVYRKAEVWRKRRDFRKALKLYESYIYSQVTNKERIVEVHFKIYDIYKSIGPYKKALTWRNKTISVQRNFGGNIGVEYAASARFDQFLELYQALKRINIPSAPPKRTLDGINKKLDMIVRLKKDMQSVLRYAHGKELVGAWTTLGLSYDHTIRAITAVPLPAQIRKLPQEEINKYKSKVESTFVDPLKQPRLDSFKQAVADGARLESFSEYLAMAHRNLNILDPKNYPFVSANLSTANEPDLMGL